MNVSEGEISPEGERLRDRYPVVGFFVRLFERIGQGTIIFLILFILLLSALYPAIVRMIPAGAAGVIFKPLSGGTMVDRVYGEGVHVKYPWDTLYVYNIRIQTILHDFTVLTQEGLPVTLRLAIRFRPEPDMIGQLHKHVGPNYAETIIVYQIESVLRKRLGAEHPEDIYNNEAGILTSVLADAAEEVGQRYVKINDVIIREVVLPAEISAAITEKLVHQQREAAYVFRLGTQEQEAQRLRIEAEGIRDYQATVNETLNDQLLTWRGIQATVDLAKSNNSKVVVIGSGDKGLPLILGPDTVQTAPPPADTALLAPTAPATAPAAIAPTPALPAIRDQVADTVREIEQPQPELDGDQVVAFPDAEDLLEPSRRNRHVFEQDRSSVAGVAPGFFTPGTTPAPRYELKPDPLFEPHGVTPQPIEGTLLPSNNNSPRAKVGGRALTAAEFLQAPLDMLP
ncbi:prohibitin family protein [uncultured Tateyamaria sp.]|uniref:prohibitin family protein n=1 Tax=uncultured Tateyamaria sp. TaxID=455651 RepID=UPI00262818B2|nr:prohibitin family protein [uncultured Tateyamaria sp.]